MINVEQISPSKFLVRGEDLSQCVECREFARIPGVKPVANKDGEIFGLEIHRSHIPLLNHYKIPQPEGRIESPRKGLIASAPGPLREYQKEAVSFARGRAGVLFIHGLGLGKTWMALASLVYPSIVVVPTSALQVWQREAALFKLSTQVLQGVSGATLSKISSDVDLYITTYGSMDAWLPYFRASAAGPRIYSICADEAHHLHRKWSRWSAMFKAIQNDFTLLMTATPMRNRLKSLHGLLDAVAPGAFGSLSEFRSRYCGATFGQYGLEDGPFLTNTDELAQRLGELAVRESWLSPRVRHLRPVLNRLLIGVDIGVDERACIVGNVLREVYRSFGRDGSGVAGAHLVIATKLRIKVGRTKTRWFLSEGKLSDLIEKHHRVIVWTWYREVAAMVRDWAKENLDVPVDYITGEANTTKRQKLLDEWQDGDPKESRLLVATQGALATAVNLTTAEAAVWLEYSYAPIDIQQAEARHHRPGSRFDEVYAYYVFAKKTIDEHLVRILLEKIEQVEEVLGSSSQKDQMLTLLGERPWSVPK